MEGQRKRGGIVKRVEGGLGGILVDAVWEVFWIRDGNAREMKFALGGVVPKFVERRTICPPASLVSNLAHTPSSPSTSGEIYSICNGHMQDISHHSSFWVLKCRYDAHLKIVQSQ